jgi:predicted acylesterase/phospholipase RssA
VATPNDSRGCPDPARLDADIDDLTGIALSGGGIRSATFGLGVLQGLAELNLLRVFDYLSTVSGGGFVGGWWSAWLSRKRRPPGSYFPAGEELEPHRRPSILLRGAGETAAPELPDGSMSARHDDPIHHLRLFANYLTPRMGALSADTWRAITFYVRNVSFTWLAFIPLLLAIVLFAQVVYLLDMGSAQEFLCPQRSGVPPAADIDPLGFCAGFDYGSSARGTVTHRFEHLGIPGAALLGAVLMLSGLWFVLATANHVMATLGIVVQSTLVVWLWTRARPDDQGWGGAALAAVLAALVSFAWYATHLVRSGLRGRDVRDARRAGRPVPDMVLEHRVWIAQRHSQVLRIGVLAGVILLVAGFGHDIVWWLTAPDTPLESNVMQRASGWTALLASAASAIFTAIRGAPSTKEGDTKRSPGRVAQIVFIAAPFLVLAALLVLLAWLGRLILEWWTWRAPDPHVLTGATLVSSAVPLAFAYWEAFHSPPRPDVGGDPRWWLRMPPRAWVCMACGAVVVVTIVARVFEVGAAGVISLDRDEWTAVGGLGVCLVPALVPARWRPSIVNGRSASLMAIAAVGFGVQVFFGVVFDDVRATSVAPTFAALSWVLLLLGWVVALGWLADPNSLAMHAFYKARLTRAYLGASNLAREHETVTDAAPGDDLKLTELWNHDEGAPYHLINTTLNLVGGSDLATAQRAAANFVLSKYHCGSARTGYRCTSEYMDGSVSLGTAVAISGAAVSPNMGAKSPSAALSMLLALFNVRLGYWIPHPGRYRWRDAQARLWPFYLLRESLSNTGDLGTYTCLTDGGHFDNTGIYALVERGCRFIVAVDCGADPHLRFADIGDSIRRCRIDFGTEIELDVQMALERSADDRELAARPFVKGKIRYHPEHWRMLGFGEGSEEERTGSLIWIKPAVTRRSAGDVRQYDRENGAFPQQSTGDQWYDEAQFESYRKLGYDTAKGVFEGRQGIYRAQPGDVARLFLALGEPETRDGRRAMGGPTRTTGEVHATA